MNKSATKWKVGDKKDLFRLFDHLSGIKDSFTVTVKEGEETRRDRQNRLAFLWYKDIAQQIEDHTVEEARAISKLHCGVQLLVNQEEAFREQWQRLIRDRFTYEEKLELMLEPADYPVTRIMSVKQMTGYLDRMQRYWAPRGVVLTDPEALKYARAA